MTTLLYVHDPMCSWCWGFRPTWLALRQALPAGLAVRNLLGGLAPDTDAPMPDELQATIRGHWETIRRRLGTEFNFDFWKQCQPRRDTYKACRAVIAAGEREEDMIEAIQRAYYLRALNPSEPATLVQLAGEIGLDQAAFAARLQDPATDTELQRQVAQARRLGIRSFPSLVLVAGQGAARVAIDYQDLSPMRARIGALLEELPQDEEPHHQESDR